MTDLNSRDVQAQVRAHYRTLAVMKMLEGRWYRVQYPIYDGPERVVVEDKVTGGRAVLSSSDGELTLRHSSCAARLSWLEDTPENQVILVQEMARLMGDLRVVDPYWQQISRLARRIATFLFNRNPDDHSIHQGRIMGIIDGNKEVRDAYREACRIKPAPASYEYVLGLVRESYATMRDSRRWFFALDNQYGTPTSLGFSNTWIVRAFPSRRRRDNWVKLNGDRMCVMAIRKDMVARYVSETPRPFSGSRYVIDRDLEGGYIVTVWSEPPGTPETYIRSLY